MLLDGIIGIDPRETNEINLDRPPLLVAVWTVRWAARKCFTNIFVLGGFVRSTQYLLYYCRMAICEYADSYDQNSLPCSPIAHSNTYCNELRKLRGVTLVAKYQLLLLWSNCCYPEKFVARQRTLRRQKKKTYTRRTFSIHPITSKADGGTSVFCLP